MDRGAWRATVQGVRQRSLAGYSPRGHKELAQLKWLSMHEDAIWGA